MAFEDIVKGGAQGFMLLFLVMNSFYDLVLIVGVPVQSVPL